MFNYCDYCLIVAISGDFGRWPPGCARCRGGGARLRGELDSELLATCGRRHRRHWSFPLQCAGWRGGAPRRLAPFLSLSGEMTDHCVRQGERLVVTYGCDKERWRARELRGGDCQHRRRHSSSVCVAYSSSATSPCPALHSIATSRGLSLTLIAHSSVIDSRSQSG